jgi:hypothetical protein
MTYWTSESRESCHPVKNANRNPSDIGKTKTIKRYWLLACERPGMGNEPHVWRVNSQADSLRDSSFTRASIE